MKVGFVGSGSWGTALAQVCCDNGHDSLIWGRSLDEIVDIARYHQNEKCISSGSLTNNINVGGATATCAE